MLFVRISLLYTQQQQQRTDSLGNGVPNTPEGAGTGRKDLFYWTCDDDVLLQL